MLDDVRLDLGALEDLADQGFGVVADESLVPAAAAFGLRVVPLVEKVPGGAPRPIRFGQVTPGGADSKDFSLWTYPLTEAWARSRSEAELLDRPSRADERRAWRREILDGEILALLRAGPTAAEIQAAADRLLRLAA